MEILVTGGTGTLGRVVVDRLRSDGHQVRVMSRSDAPGLIQADLGSNSGVAAALLGADVVVHCATGRHDAALMTNLLASAAGTRPHIVYISIVGVDKIPFFYYRQKLRAEAMLSASGLPFTILRATQFHTLVAGIFDAQKRMPVLVVPGFAVQPVDVAEVAAVLADLAVRAPAGRVPDLGGPEIREAHEFASQWQRAEGRVRRQVPLLLPGGTFRALRAGHNVVRGLPTGSVTFEEYLGTR